MGIRRMQWRAFTGGLWFKGPRENNPQGTLRRAKSIFPLRTGSIRSRSGIATIANLEAHSLFKYGGRRIAGVAAQIWREVATVFTQLTTGVPTLNGNRLVFVSAPPTAGKQDYVFVAGGGALFKINPALDTATTWGIAPPAGTAPTGTAATLNATTIDTFDSAASWTVTDVDDDDTTSVNGTKANDTDKKTEGTGSLRFRTVKNTTTRADKAITVDLNTFAGPLASGDEDYIEFYVAFNRPKHIKNLEIMFYVGAAAPADFDKDTDTYSRELTFTLVKKKKKKRLFGTGDLIRPKDVQAAIESGRTDKVDFSMAEFTAEDTVAVTRRAWTRVTIPKASFKENGRAGTTGFTWANVQAVRISVETTKQGASRVWLDRIRLVGGVGMQGDYQYMFTLRNSSTGTRSNPFPTTTDAESGDTLFNPVIVRGVERQGVSFTTLQSIAPTADSQVDEIEIWRTVGNGIQFFLAERVPVATTTHTDNVADYPGMFSGGGGTKFLQPEELPDDNARPDDTLTDAVGPFAGRMFITRGTTTGQGNRVWYSGVGRLESVSNYIEVGGTDETVQKLIVWNETLYAVTSRTAYRLINTDEPFVFLEVNGVRGTVLPRTVVATPWGIVWQANDGIRVFDGLRQELIADDALAPIFRGGTSDGLDAFTGALAEYGRNEYYITDASTTTLAFGPDGGWRELGVWCNALYYETDTGILLATVNLLAAPIAAIVIRQTGNIATTTASPFVSFDGSLQTTHADARARSPIAMTVTSMYVLLSAALAGGGTATFRVNVNGVAQSGVSVVISSGGTSGNATGTVSIAEDDLVSLEVTYTGGTVAATIQACTLGYRVEE